MKKQILAMLLAALMLSAGGCGNAEPEGEDTDTAAVDTSAEAAETEKTVDPAELDELPTDCLDYEGMNFTVLYRDRTGESVTWQTWDIYTEELNGERINDAVFARNLAMADRFGVVVTEMPVTDRLNTAKQLIQSGDDVFDLFQDHTQNQSQLVIQGYVLNMSEMEYINFSKAWWDSTAIEGISIGDKIYYGIGDSQLNGKKSTWVVMFNKSLTANAGITGLYDTVKENDWTLDLFNQYGETIAQDTDGDGEMTWGTDVFGIGLQNEVVLPLLLGSGEKLIDIQEDGSYVYNMGNANVVDAMEQIHTFLNSGNHILNCNLAGEYTDNWVEFRNLFMSDKIGFFMGPLSAVTLVGGDMLSDFGILPFPKLDPEQDGYYSTFQYNNADAVSVPKTCSDTTRVGMLTEAYQMFAHDTIMPAYYEYTLTLRNARDTDSGEMLDIIFGSRNFDISFAFNSSTGMQTFLQDIGIASTFNYASKEASNRTKVDKAVSEILEAVAGLAE
ncbi:MAG: hypothetical protein IJ480_00960 [Clostridia bacterium]|nr:hypothetical protein [Clostridia bacterium]